MQLPKILSAVPRRFYTIFWLMGLVVVALIFFSGRGDGFAFVSDWQTPFTTDDGLLGSVMGYFGDETNGDETRIAIVNSIKAHDEVLAALVHSFGGHPNARVNVFLYRQRYEMEKIMRNFTLASRTTVRGISAFKPAMMRNPHPHVVVSTTCELDLKFAKPGFQNLLDNGATHLFCVIHHADQWDKGGHVDFARKWAEKGKLDFVALSQHTADFLLKETIPKWKADYSVTARVLPPVFPVEHPPNEEEGISLAMQGDYSSGRRDYEHIFTGLGGVIEKLESPDSTQKNQSLQLHVIGHGTTPKVPKVAEGHVIFDASLSYPDFYAVLSRAFAVIPGFASDTYLDRKASSTVPASLIAGAPLLVNDAILKAYSYLPREAAWVAKSGEEDMDAIKRMIGNQEEFVKKRDLARKAAVDIMAQNRINIQKWTAEVRRKMDNQHNEEQKQREKEAAAAAAKSQAAEKAKTETAAAAEKTN
ncbi:hypothetical protein EDB81DRAFT_431935 [Dactylonectria macrodidyma]|uniref:Uncharacterized protein n=1 Tax=Dactylonectria macrodidyma TaxID=307937 RepID=A0A9P9F4U5_9HYPO|nr:hypothetical protein EDB81DRAFT_431935 [Dactylonectria macrodidyma]